MHVGKVAFAALLILSSSGCLARQVRNLVGDLEDARSSDARTGVLVDELDAASAARLELIGRTSAPTRYGERTEANRIRIVAFDFGGAKLGTRADFAGNLLTSSCLTKELTSAKVQVGPWLGEGLANPDASPQSSATPKPKPKDFNFYKGMFRQYEKRVGTTIEFDAAIGPTATKMTTYFSNNLLVLEWRRYQLSSLREEYCIEPHVSSVETGIAVRIVFDVRLRSTNASINATFGIAELAASLARNEARVDVSYEVVGTALDLLPRKSIVISSLSEYLDALDRFHAAVVTISDAWATVSQADPSDQTIKLTIDGKDHNYPRNKLFVPDELAYYVSGQGVGDAFLHMENVDACNDLQTLLQHYKDLIKTHTKELDEVNDKIKTLETRRKKRLSRTEATNDRRALQEQRTKQRQLQGFLEKTARRRDIVDFSFTQGSCAKSLDLEKLRIAHVCAVEALETESFRSSLESAQCARAKPAVIADQIEYLEAVRVKQENRQRGAGPDAS